MERQHPSPVEWSYFTRSAFRAAYARMDPEFNGSGVVDWAAIGTDFRHALERLENPKTDGQGLVNVLDGASGDEIDVIAGVGRAGYDISAKSYPWRAGYFEVLMGCARAAEFLDDMVRDKTRKLVFPKDVMIGPSNPNPKPVSPNMATAPLEENCDKPYAPPETFYMRVLTGTGFTTRQRVDAALAYANWLEFKDAHETAEDVYKWAIDIAFSAAPGVEISADTKNAVLKETDSATPNLVRATTALASHHARNGDVANALPIYLATLRAILAAPVDATSALATQPNNRAQSSTDYGAVYKLLRSLIRSSAYPPDGPTGDEPLLRKLAPQSDCVDAEIMLYIGEILFTTASTKPDEGLGWTKQAVGIAQTSVNSNQTPQADKKRCKACLELGVGNWSTMVQHLARVEKALKEREGNAGAGWRGWFGGAKRNERSDEVGQWEEEAKVVEDMREKLIREGISEQLVANAGGVPGSSYIG